MNFSKHLAAVYTLIIAIPLILIILGLSEYLRQSMYASLASDAASFVNENARHVTSSIEKIERIEAIVSSDYDLQRAFYFANNSEDDQSQIIETLNREIRILERIQFGIPDIYAVKIYVSNPAVPEKWPIIFSQRRVNLSVVPRWTWNHTEPVMSSLATSTEKSGCLTEELLLNRRHVGWLQITMKMTDLFPFLFRSVNEYNKDYVFSSPVSLGSGREFSEEIRRGLAAFPPSQKSGSYSVQSGMETRIAAFTRLDRVGLILVHAVSPAMIQRSIFFIRAVSVLILLVSIVVMFLIISFATRRMVTRLYTVMDAMKEIRAGNLDVSIQVAGEDEVAEMAIAFTEMVQRIQILVARIEWEQRLVTETEIKAMQNQINAHFLYNALENIKMQAEVCEQPAIAKSVTLLGRMMRYCLKWRTHQVRLSQELDYSRDYIELMNIRNDYRIRLEIHVAPSLLSFELPKMLIQPVIENAVVHGIEPEGEDSVIKLIVSTDEEKKRLTIAIADGGCGMTAQQVTEIEKRLGEEGEGEAPVGGIGLFNIQKRLCAFYGPEWKLEIVSSPGIGTTVMIPVPME